MGFACCSVSGGVRLGRSEQCRSRHRLCVAVALPSQMVEDVNVGVYFYHYSTDTSQWEPPPSFLHDVCRGWECLAVGAGCAMSLALLRLAFVATRSR